MSGARLTRRMLLAGAGALAGGPLAAQEGAASAFYRGKTVRLLVGSPPGGGYDLYARMIAPFAAKRLGATIVVENRDGNGGLLALNYLMSRPADGLAIMHASAEAATLSQLLARDGVVWDVTKLQWLARTSVAPKLWFVGRTSRLRTIADAQAAASLTWAATGLADNISDVACVISYALGLKSRVVVGYRGAGDMSLSVVRNETDCGILSADSAQALVAAGDVRPLAVLAARRWPHLPDVPTLAEAAAVPDDKRWLVALRQDLGDAQRAMVAAPDTPQERVTFLRAAFADALRDPALIEEGARTNREIDFLSGVDLEAKIGALMRDAQPRLPLVRRVLLDTYF